MKKKFLSLLLVFGSEDFQNLHLEVKHECINLFENN